MTARSRPRAVVVGSGVESLVASCVLARAGFETLVLEKRAEPGGTRARWPDARGFDVPLVLDDAPGVHPAVVRTLDLRKHGAVFASNPRPLAIVDADGRVLQLPGDVETARAAIEPFSGRDADAYGRFSATLDRISRAISPILHRAPPSRRPADLWTGVLTGRRYLGLPRRDAFALLRWPPMPVADLVEEWFECEPLRALVATHGLFGVFGGPRSAGTAAVLLLRAATDGGLVSRAPVVAGGARAIVEALVACARAAGVVTKTSAEVSGILVERDRVAGVRLCDGSRIEAAVVVSGIGPRKTLLDLIEPMVLAPGVVGRVKHVRARGTIARALIVVADVAGVTTRSGAPLPIGTTLHLAPTVDHLERAFDAMKYGGWAERPWLEVRTYAPMRGDERAAGLMALSVTAHQVPHALRGEAWPAARLRLAEAIIATLDDGWPGLKSRIVTSQLLTPDDLEAELGLTGGHPLHAELGLDQLWIARPALGLGGYRSPVEGLYLCGPGTHPGIGPAGTSGLLAGRAVIRDVARREASPPTRRSFASPPEAR